MRLGSRMRRRSVGGSGVGVRLRVGFLSLSRTFLRWWLEICRSWVGRKVVVRVVVFLRVGLLLLSRSFLQWWH